MAVGELIAFLFITLILVSIMPIGVALVLSVVSLLLFIIPILSICSAIDRGLKDTFLFMIIFVSWIISFFENMLMTTLLTTLIVSVLVVYFTEKQVKYVGKLIKKIEKEIDKNDGKIDADNLKILAEYVSRFRRHKIEALFVKDGLERIHNILEVNHSPNRIEKNIQNKKSYIDLSQRETEDEKQSDEIKEENIENVDIKKYTITRKPSSDPEDGVYLDDSNFRIFYDFVSHTDKSLDIITNTIDGEILIKLMSRIVGKGIKVRIITRRHNKKAATRSLADFMNLEVRQVRNIHAKIIIRDQSRILIGSSNITNSSLSEFSGFYDANAVSSNDKSVSTAKKLFNSLWDEDDIMGDDYTSLVYSRDSKNHLPVFVENLIRNEKDEVMILVSLGQIDKSVIEKIIDCNQNAKLILVVNEKPVETSEITKNNLEAMKYIKESAEISNDKINVIVKKPMIHAKVYIFRGQKKIFISSMNLTEHSWGEMLEAGIILGEKELGEITEIINELPNGKIVSLDGYLPIEKPPSTWSPEDPKQIRKIPWELPGFDSEFAYNPLEKRYFKKSKRTPEKDLSKQPEQYTKSSDFRIGNIKDGYEREVIRSILRQQASTRHHPGHLKDWTYQPHSASAKTSTLFMLRALLSRLEEGYPKFKSIPEIKDYIKSIEESE